MTMTGTVKNYPLQTYSINFKLNVTEYKNGTVDGVAVKTGTAPFLQPIPPAQFNLVFGDPWVYSFRVLDADNDLISTNVKLGVASVFIQFDKGSNIFNIARNNTAELVGSFPISIEVIDLFKNTNTYSFSLIITCPAGYLQSSSNTCSPPVAEIPL